MSFVVRIRQHVRDYVTQATVLWAIAMAVVLVDWEVNPATDARAVLAGVLVTALFGVYLGWRRRWPYVFVAPMVSFFFNVLPLWIAAMVRHGVVKGLFVGLFLNTVGAALVGTAEFLCLAAVTLMVRRARGNRVDDGDVIVCGPDGRG